MLENNDFEAVNLTDHKQLRVNLWVDDFEQERLNIREWTHFKGQDDWFPSKKGIAPLISDFHDKIMPLLNRIDKSIGIK